MGLAKRRLEEIEARGASFIGDKYVCAECLGDYALKNFVSESGACKNCDYCDDTNPTVPVDDVVELVIDGIRTEYDEPGNGLGWASEEGGWLGNTIDTWGLLVDLEVAENESLFQDIHEAITAEIWCGSEFYGLTHDKRLIYGWQEFCELVKHRNRFFFVDASKREADPLAEHATPEEVLAAIGESLSELNLTVRLEKGTKIFRARPHSCDETYTSVEDLGPPPREKAKASRMSSQGIPMFYGGFDGRTCLKEVAFPDRAPCATVAEFVTTEAFSVVDLTGLPRVPSIFDQNNRHLRPLVKFLRDFVRDFSRPIEPTDAALEYVPTQIVTEFFRDGIDFGLKGVIYPSSRHDGGRSCVLFFENDECKPQTKAWRSRTQYLELQPDSVEVFRSSARLASSALPSSPRRPEPTLPLC